MVWVGIVDGRVWLVYWFNGSVRDYCYVHGDAGDLFGQQYVEVPLRSWFRMEPVYGWSAGLPQVEIQVKMYHNVKIVQYKLEKKIVGFNFERKFQSTVNHSPAAKKKKKWLDKHEGWKVFKYPFVAVRKRKIKPHLPYYNSTKKYGIFFLNPDHFEKKNCIF